MELPWKVCFRAGATVFLLYLCIRCSAEAAELAGVLFHASAPLLLGCAIAYVVNLPMSSLERRWGERLPGLRRPVCMLGAYLTLAGAIFLLLRLVVPELSACIHILLGALPGVLTRWTQAAAETGALPPALLEVLDGIDWDSCLRQLLRVLTAGLGGAAETLAGLLSSLLSWTATGGIALVFSAYLLSGKEKLRRQGRSLAKRYMRPLWREKLKKLLGTVDDCFHSYITGQCAEAVILGALCTAGMLVLRLPYGGMIGALTGFCALIPVVGAYLGGGIGAVMLLTVSPAKAAIFLLFLLLLQQVEGNLIYPRVVGASVGLPGIWVLAAVTVGGGLLGVTGMLLGVPLAAVLYRLLREDLSAASQQSREET